jgi:hypothetical protein
MIEIKRLTDLPHEIMNHKDKRIVVCTGHFCDLDGLVEDEYLKRLDEK